MLSRSMLPHSGSLFLLPLFPPPTHPVLLSIHPPDGSCPTESLLHAGPLLLPPYRTRGPPKFCGGSRGRTGKGTVKRASGDSLGRDHGEGGKNDLKTVYFSFNHRRRMLSVSGKMNQFGRVMDGRHPKWISTGPSEGIKDPQWSVEAHN